MPKFLITYHGSQGPPPDPEARKQIEAAFMAWAQSVGSALADPGAPLANFKTVSSSGVVDGQAGGVFGGYTILDTPDVDAAVKLCETHPFVKRGGQLQVSQSVGLD